MRVLGCLLAVGLFAAAGVGGEPVNITFNLVQVNHYSTQQETEQGLKTPGERIVIDLQNPLNAANFLSAVMPKLPRAVSVSAFTAAAGATVPLPWETSAVLVSPSGQDSFFVTSSRAGCPGTEIKPSVAVAFATGRGWSDPIRFGPIAERATCALGRGCSLEVKAAGDAPPSVRITEDRADFGRR